MEYLLQQLITGLTLDSIHVLIPIGYTAVHGTIGLIDLAQGGIFMVGSFIVLATFHALAALGLSASPSILFITLLAAILFTSARAWAVARLACGRLCGPIQRSCSLRATPWGFEKNKVPCQSPTMTKPVWGISV